MEQNNVLATDITDAEGKERLDAACKKILANKSILARILKECVEEYKDCTIKDIEEKYIEGEPQIASVPVYPDETNPIIKGAATEDITQTEGTVTYDIRFYAIVPGTDEVIRLIINIEAQNKYNPGYPLTKRGIYYCCRMISSQKEVEFIKSNYGDIKKVYSIWVCIDPTADRRNTITRYSLKEENLVGEAKELVQNYDLLTLIMICLGSDTDAEPKGVLRLLDMLLRSGRKSDEKKKMMQEDFDIEVTQMLNEEELAMCNYSDYIEERGIKKGMAQGMEKGMAQGVLGAIRNLMDSMKMTAEQAMSALKVPESDYEKYKAMMR